MNRRWLLLLVGLAVVFASQQPASALPPFNKEWLGKYVAGNSDKKFVAAAGAAKCNVCHLGNNKKDKNEYGVAVGKYLNKAGLKAAGAAAPQWIVSGLDKAAAEKNTKGEVFADLIKQGKLPGGN
jgi:hypothetical protein